MGSDFDAASPQPQYQGDSYGLGLSFPVSSSSDTFRAVVPQPVQLFHLGGGGKDGPLCVFTLILLLSRSLRRAPQRPALLSKMPLECLRALTVALGLHLHSNRSREATCLEP